MPRFTLSPYIVRVKKRGTTDEYYGLDSLPNEEGNPSRDLLYVMQDYLKNLQNQYVRDPDEDDKVVHLDEVRSSGRDICGVVSTGESGLQSDLYDLQAEEIAFTRQVHHAEMYPFYFLVHIPEGANFGFVILQRFNIYGIRTILFRAFASYLKEMIPEVTFEINPMTETAALRQFMNEARLTEIRAIKYSVPSDRANEFGQGLTEEEGILTYSLSAKREGNFAWFHNKLNRFIGNEIGLNELVLLRDFTPDTVKVQFDLNGVHRTFDLSHPARVAPYYDITSDITLAPNGFPTYESVNRIAHEHLRRFLEARRAT